MITTMGLGYFRLITVGWAKIGAGARIWADFGHQSRQS
jgi:hypothetical protein